MVYPVPTIGSISFTDRMFVPQLREASKASSGISKNKKTRTKKKHRGLKVDDGDVVQKGSILCTQLQLRYYPGENVCPSYQISSNSCWLKPWTNITLSNVEIY